MCKVIEDMRKEAREEGYKEGFKVGYKAGFKVGYKAVMRTIALRMLSNGTLALEKIAEYVDLPLDEIKKLQAEQSA